MGNEVFCWDVLCKKYGIKGRTYCANVNVHVVLRFMDYSLIGNEGP